MDSVQKDKILNHLGIMHKAAINVATEGDVGEEDTPIFGHLHLVFRDWRFEGDEASVMKDIFKEERGADTATAVRNQIRRSVKDSFQSVSVWLLPPPSDSTQTLRSELTVQGASVAFRSKLREFRGALVSGCCLAPVLLFVWHMHLTVSFSLFLRQTNSRSRCSSTHVLSPGDTWDPWCKPSCKR